jgi:hypothetical protein
MLPKESIYNWFMDTWEREEYLYQHVLIKTSFWWKTTSKVLRMMMMKSWNDIITIIMHPKVPNPLGF